MGFNITLNLHPFIRTPCEVDDFPRNHTVGLSSDLISNGFLPATKRTPRSIAMVMSPPSAPQPKTSLHLLRSESVTASVAFPQSYGKEFNPFFTRTRGEGRFLVCR